MNREYYLNMLINSKDNGKIKVLTGTTGSGKTYLLKTLYKEYLVNQGIEKDYIIHIDFEKQKYSHIKNTAEVISLLSEKINKQNKYYIFLDEILTIEDYEDLLEELLELENIDVYIAVSNSKFITPELRIRIGNELNEIFVMPLSFKEFRMAYSEITDDIDVFEKYMEYGGMPGLLEIHKDKDKEKYLTQLIDGKIIPDIIKQYTIYHENVFIELTNLLAKYFGKSSTPFKMVEMMRGDKDKLSDKTLRTYLDYLIDSFLINEVYFYDVKKKKEIKRSVNHFYYDVGLLCVKKQFENINNDMKIKTIIHSELVSRGLDVYYGRFEIFSKDSDGKTLRKFDNIDFVIKDSVTNRHYYIELASDTDVSINGAEKKYSYIRDSFKKFILVREQINPQWTEKGVVIMSVTDFLLNKDSLDM